MPNLPNFKLAQVLCEALDSADWVLCPAIALIKLGQ